MQTVMMKVVSNQVTLMQFIDFSFNILLYIHFLPYTLYRGTCCYSHPSIYSGIFLLLLLSSLYSGSLLLLLLSFHILRKFFATPLILPYTQGAYYYCSYPSIYPRELVTSPILPYTQGAYYYSSFPSIIYSGSLLLLLLSFHIPRELITTTPILPYTQGSLLLLNHHVLILSFHIPRKLATPPILSLLRELVTIPPILPYTQGACFYYSYPFIYLYSVNLLLLSSFHILRELFTAPSISFHILRELVTAHPILPGELFTPPILPYTQGACYYSHPSIYSGICYFSFYPSMYSGNLLLLLPCFNILRELVATPLILPYTQGACY